MNISALWHKILTEITTLLHIHPSNTAATETKKAEIIALADHPGLLPEQKEAVKTLTETAAASVPPLLPVTDAPAAPTTPAP